MNSEEPKLATGFDRQQQQWELMKVCDGCRAPCRVNWCLPKMRLHAVLYWSCPWTWTWTKVTMSVSSPKPPLSFFRQYAVVRPCSIPRQNVIISGGVICLQLMKVSKLPPTDFCDCCLQYFRSGMFSCISSVHQHLSLAVPIRGNPFCAPRMERLTFWPLRSTMSHGTRGWCKAPRIIKDA